MFKCSCIYVPKGLERSSFQRLIWNNVETTADWTNRDKCTNTIHLLFVFTFISHPTWNSHPILQSVHVQAGTQIQPLVHAGSSHRSAWLKLTLSVNTPITNLYYSLTWSLPWCLPHSYTSTCSCAPGPHNQCEHSQLRSHHPFVCLAICSFAQNYTYSWIFLAFHLTFCHYPSHLCSHLVLQSLPPLFSHLLALSSTHSLYCALTGPWQILFLSISSFFSYLCHTLLYHPLINPPGWHSPSPLFWLSIILSGQDCCFLFCIDCFHFNIRFKSSFKC